MNWKSFLLGLGAGVVATVLATWLLGNRYSITSNGAMVVRLDRWTGRTWLARHDYENRFFWAAMEDEKQK